MSDQPNQGPLTFLREPLLHFLLIGAALFLVYRAAQGPSAVDADKEVIVTQGRIVQLATIFERTWQRVPTGEELQGLIDDFVLEEIYYQQAIAMGIDRDDTIIRRRLRQKLEFLSDDMTALEEATDEELLRYLTEHADDFRDSPTYIFQQVYFNPEKHGPDPEAFVRRQRDALRTGAEVQGDSSLLPPAFQDATPRAIDSMFGSGFCARLDELTVGEWEGPLRSGVGFHLVRLDSRTSGRLPPLTEIRESVVREWSNAKRLTARRQMNDRLRAEYKVVIEWPQDSVAEDEGDGP